MKLELNATFIQKTINKMYLILISSIDVLLSQINVNVEKGHVIILIFFNIHLYRSVFYNNLKYIFGFFFSRFR